MIEHENQLPDPLTPEDCDISHFGIMPFDVKKFRDSNFSLTIDPAIGFRAVMLWAAAWHQVPAASLPDNDIVLFRLSGCLSLDEFKAIKHEVMHGFILCSDGRWYHKFMSSLALSAWKKSKKAKESISVRWSNNDSNNEEKENEEQTKNDTNTNVCTNVIPREDMRGNDKKGNDTNTVDSPPSGEQAEQQTDHVMDNFNRLWKPWPTKNNKQAAIKAFRKLCKGKSPDNIARNTTVLLNDIERKIAYIAGRESPFMKTLLSTYLNGAMWKDEGMPLVFEKRISNSIASRQEQIQQSRDDAKAKAYERIFGEKYPGDNVIDGEVMR